MQTAEQLRQGGNKRNVLQILSSNTRRTKVVELSSGTHRVPDELKKHYLSDGEGGQYSTNLDRNRYGNDDNYLFTVIRYDLEFLGLCPCMVDVEIIDAKQGNSSIIVSAGTEVCTCQGGPPLGGAVAGAGAVGPLGSGGGGVGGVHPGHMAAAAMGHLGAPPAQTFSGGDRHGVAIKPEYHAPDAAAAMGALAAGANGAYAAAGMTLAGLPGLGVAGLPGLPGVPGVPPVVPGVPGVPGVQGMPGVPGLGPADLAAVAGGAGPPLFGPGGFRGPAAAALGGGPVGRESPKRSGTSVSQLFDALVMAATGGADGAAAAGGLGGEPPVTSAAHVDQPRTTAGGMAGGGGTGGAGGGATQRLHPPPNRNKSKLWSLNNLSYGGEVDSLQNALDAFREQDEIASGDPAAFLASGLGPDGSTGGGLQRSDSLRQRRRKPVRNSSILGRPASSSGMAPLGSKLMGGAMSLREKSDDNLKLAAADPDLGAALGAMNAGAHPAGILPGASFQVSSLASGEDDNDGGGDQADGGTGGDEALAAAKGEDLGVEGEGEAGGEGGEEGMGEGAEEGGAGRGGAGGGPTASGTLRAGALGARSPLRHHVRHVPRQSSVANLAPRVAGAAGAGAGALGLLGPSGLGGSAQAAIAGEQLKRLANELEVMRAENRSLRQQLQRSNSFTGAQLNAAATAAPGGVSAGAGAGASAGNTAANGSPSLAKVDASESARLRKLESELASMRGELHGLSDAKKTAEDEATRLRRELLASQQQVAALLNKVLSGAGVAGEGAGGDSTQLVAQLAATMKQAAGGSGPEAVAAAHAAGGSSGATAKAGTSAPAGGGESRKRSGEEAGVRAADGSGSSEEGGATKKLAVESSAGGVTGGSSSGGALDSLPSLCPVAGLGVAASPALGQALAAGAGAPLPAESVLTMTTTRADSMCFSDLQLLGPLPNLDGIDFLAPSSALNAAASSRGASAAPVGPAGAGGGSASGSASLPQVPAGQPGTLGAGQHPLPLA
ncbi:hypothetical protein HXX76_000970 [Chlamydomonas incerta]|uniref:Uncharacterized protein n=1 Tax=Chlamydomonas incerta TaxID=51695 RepID=A0A835WG13_CHLIN|nr:hypothetical protein HXX76_000970 [Chlamydomonas incerta]|eukprot:KAG2446385.1 hypothetical protein HXX76_000970 [Chlamydomonas incerta]